MEHKDSMVEEEEPEELQQAWDSLSGATLGPSKVRQARREEVEYVRAMGVYAQVLATERRQPICERPATVRTRGHPTIPITVHVWLPVRSIRTSEMIW